MQPGQCARSRDPRRHVAACLLVCAASLLPGCLRAQARSVEIPLDMPAPPPRIVEVADPDVPPIVPLPEEPARSTPRLRPAPPRTENRGTEPSRPEPPADPARPVEDVRPAPAPTLQTTPTQQELELERRIRGMLAQAATDLNRTNYQALNTDGRTQYDTAKRFISQAEDAVRIRNLVFANNLADKAATLAAQLVGR